jgi:hypothetical protein
VRGRLLREPEQQRLTQKNLRTRLRLRLLPHRIERVLAAAAVIYGAHDFR